MVTPSFSAGAYTHSLCQELAHRGCDVELVTGPAYHRFIAPGTPVAYRLRLAFYRRTQLRSYDRRWTRPVWRLFRLLGHLWSMTWLVHRARDFDIIHIQFLTIPSLDVWWLPFLRRRAPLVFTVHNLYPHDKKRTPALRRVLHRIYHTADHLVAHTQHTTEGLVRDFGIPRERITRHPLGQQLPLAGSGALPSAPSDPAQILMFGEVRPSKGLDLLIQALARLRDDSIPCRLVVAGAAERDIAGHRQLAAELGVSDAVEFRIGWVPETEVAALFAKAAVVALPYRAIDQSALAVMAVSLGKAVVATLVGGVAELVEDAECGLLTPVGDDRALAAALRRMICEPAFREDCEANARRYAEKALAWPPIAELTEQMYRRVLGASTQTTPQLSQP